MNNNLGCTGPMGPQGAYGATPIFSELPQFNVQGAFQQALNTLTKSPAQLQAEAAAVQQALAEQEQRERYQAAIPWVLAALGVGVAIWAWRQ